MLLKSEALTRERESKKPAQNGSVLIVALLIIVGIIGSGFVAYKIFRPTSPKPSSKTEIRNTPTLTPSVENQPLPQDETVKNNSDDTSVFNEQTVKCLGADRKYSYVTQEICNTNKNYWVKILGSFPTDPEEIIRCLGADGKYSSVPRITCEDTNKFWDTHKPSSSSNNSSNSQSISNSTSLGITSTPTPTPTPTPIPWYLAGGAPTPIAAYQPKGSTNLATSYINLANPGTYNAAPGIAPIFNQDKGWRGTGTQYLSTGITPTNDQTWSTIVKFTDSIANTSKAILGARAAAGAPIWGFQPYSVGYWSGGSLTVGPNISSGVIAISGNTAYRNGIAETGNITTGVGTLPTIYLLAFNQNNTPNLIWSGHLAAAAIYNTILTPAQVLAVTNAVNELTVMSGVKGVINNHISLGNVLQYERTQTWSVGCTLSKSSAASNAIIFSNVPNDGAFPGYELYVSPAGLLNVRLIHAVSTPAPNGSIWVKGATNIVDGNTHRVWATYDGSSTAAGVKIYVDGTLETMTTLEDTLGATIVNAAQNFYITSQTGWDDSYYFSDGWIRDFVLDNVVRDAVYVSANSDPYTVPLPDPGTRQLLLRFNEGTGTTASDTSGNGYNATLTNSATWAIY